MKKFCFDLAAYGVHTIQECEIIKENPNNFTVQLQNGMRAKVSKEIVTNTFEEATVKMYRRKLKSLEDHKFTLEEALKENTQKIKKLKNSINIDEMKQKYPEYFIKD